MTGTAVALIVALLMLTAITITVYRLRPTQPDDDPPAAATVWDATVNTLGDPDDIDTTMPAFSWPAEKESESAK